MRWGGLASRRCTPSWQEAVARENIMILRFNRGLAGGESVRNLEKTLPFGEFRICAASPLALSEIWDYLLFPEEY